MRIRIFAVLAAAAIMLAAGCGPRPLPVKEIPYGIITEHTGEQEMTLPELISRIRKADAVFIGEIHDDSLTHVLEYRLLQSLHHYNPETAVAMEMFERDVQPWLSGYLSGEVEEAAFLENSRPWGNYAAAYKPIIEYAKANGLPVLAGFVPRRYAAMVARDGEEALAALPDSEKVWIASELKPLDDAYKERFMKQMGLGDKPAMMARVNPENLYKAQSIKDDTMAETVANFMREHPGKKMVIYQGDFHSAFGLGSVKKLRLLMPGITTAVISIVPLDDFASVHPPDYKGQGDYMIFVPRVKQAR
ncbi:ChaN family lipoprotein [bacterium]|nr:ChaN family lipoprotein [bacterium]